MTVFDIVLLLGITLVFNRMLLQYGICRMNGLEIFEVEITSAYCKQTLLRIDAEAEMK